ncbi:MAG: peptidase U62 [Verrucomicrobia bacterium]|nr:peptidase U62 [Verrucomicrobiota bacterium]
MRSVLLSGAVAILFAGLSQAGPATNEAGLLRAMDAEVTRTFAGFKDRKPALYYLACGVTETEGVAVSANFGALIQDQEDHRRTLDVDARCGDYKRDNTHPLPGHVGDWSWSSGAIPLDDDETPIRMALWRTLESEYRKSSERFAQVQALDITKAALRDKSDDFSRAKAETFSGPRLTFKVDKESWKEKVKRYTLPLRQYPKIYQGGATLRAGVRTRTFVNTEGTRLQSSQVGYRLMISITTRSDDGLDLPLHESFFSWEPEGLPSDEKVMACVTNLASIAERLRSAPLVDPYTGPAILQGEAAAVFMHEVLGHRLEGHRQKDEKQSQTFKAMVGEKVMPEFLSVIFDPTIRLYKGMPLAGFYQYDEEGVGGQRVATIENGILRNFLMSRTPIERFTESNGHGRAAPGMHVVSRQSNLLLEASKTVPAAKLREMLLDECRKRNKPYGLVFAKVEGGFTMTGRYVPNAFNVSPLVVYRAYADGRPDELVRGVDIIGTPLTSITKIIAAGDDVNVFNGTCGAESGGVSVSAVAPSILIGEIEVQKKEISQASPPVLPPPGTDRTTGKEALNE